MNSIFSLVRRKSFLAILATLISFNALAEKPIYSASFADFDRRARSTKPISVVFLGGALTWGSGASDPETTSFRALMETHLREKYPSAHFNFHTAAFGGTGSKLGMFRIESDVLSRKPDLVFLDFTTEDKLDGTDRSTLGSYERILRELISRGIPVVEVLLGTKEFFGADWKHLGPTRFRDHLEMANLYHTGIGNSFPLIQNYLGSEKRKRVEIWPKGEVYPNDLGHRFFFEALRDGLNRAIQEKRVCYFPTDAVFSDEYKIRSRFFPAAWPVPQGWHVAKSLRPSPEPGGSAVDWMNEVVVADQNDDSIRPLQLTFAGTFLGLLGEADENGLGFTVSVDGEPMYFDEVEEEEVWPTSTTRSGGGSHFFWYEISDRLTPGRHTVEVLPVVGEEAGDLRIESICVAGPAPDAPQSISAQAAGL
ncbi:MAG: SGNH/GDSL hydrolase family protein [Verrucomicrobiota bacterium]